MSVIRRIDQEEFDEKIKADFVGELQSLVSLCSTGRQIG
jgi:hypothetical protein